MGDFHDFNIKADVLITEPLYFGGHPYTVYNAPKYYSRFRNYDEYIEDVLNKVRCPVMVVFQPTWREIPQVFKDWTVSIVKTGEQEDYLLSNTGISKVYEGPGRKKNPRPIEIMRPIVEDFSQEGQTVYDPFMGYGSTGMACDEREFIGIEIEEKFFRISCKNFKINGFENTITD